MFYREIEPADRHRPFVIGYWEFLGPDRPAAPIEHEIFPDGCVSLFYYRNSFHNAIRVGLTPLLFETTKRAIWAGDTFWGMRISPAACAGLLLVDPAIMREDRHFADDEFPHITSGIADSLISARSLEEAILVFEARLDELIQAPVKADAIVAEAVRSIIERRGEVKIAELAGSVDLSPRQLQRRFKRASGISPKQFARIRRIRAAAAAIVEGRNVNWAERALETGFADQSHLTNEFSLVTKRSPRAFAKKIRTIRHGNLID